MDGRLFKLTARLATCVFALSALTACQAEEIEAQSAEEAYAEVLQNYSENAVHQLIYLNDDDVPELAVLSDCAHFSGADVYAYLDGRAVQLYVVNEAFVQSVYGDDEKGFYYFSQQNAEYGVQSVFGEYGAFIYNEKQGLVWHIHDRNGGMGEDMIVCQWDGVSPEMEILHNYCINISYDEEGGYDEEYVVDGGVATREEYEEATRLLDDAELVDYTVLRENSNPYFSDAITDTEYAYCEELQYNGKAQWSIGLLGDSIRGSLYKTGFCVLDGGEYGGEGEFELSEGWEWFFWVTKDRIYYISALSDEEQKELLSTGTLPQAALLVCQEESFSDALPADEPGFHESLTGYEGDVISYQSYSVYNEASGEARDILQFVWKKDVGLIGFRYARTPAGGGSILIWNAEYLQREDMGFALN